MLIYQDKTGNHYYDSFQSWYSQSQPTYCGMDERDEWTHNPSGTVVTDTDDRDSEYKDIPRPPLMHLDYYDDKEDDLCEAPSNPTSMDTTLEPGPPSKKST